MAIYYSRLSLISRSRGHSAVAAAAYRAGTHLHDERIDQPQDFSKRKGVVSATMRAPAVAAWALDLASVWNRAEQAEVRRNARTARELIVALPAELNEKQNECLAHEIAQDLVGRYSVAALVAIHRPDAHGDERNMHAHILMSTRVAGPDGFGAKVRILDDQKTGPIEAEAMRARAAERINAALAAAGYADHVDPRRLKVQARDAAERGDFSGVINLSRTPMRHQGRAASALARHGKPSVVAIENAAVQRDNAVVGAWGATRAQTLQRVAKTRAARCMRQSSIRMGDRQRPRNGIGPLSTVARATGADADLLNAQAHAAEQSARAARDGSEKYLDLVARAVNQQAEAFQAYFDMVRAATARMTSDTSDFAAQRDAHASVELARAQVAWAAFARAKAHEERARRRTARAEYQTARSRRKTETVETAKPSVWQPLTRRQWAEHRRRQRAELTASETGEHTQRSHAQQATKATRRAHAAWETAHVALIESLDIGSKTKRTEPRSTPAAVLDADLKETLGNLLHRAPAPAFRRTFSRRPAPR